jgi:ABC-type tungstate transport system substrate-binding protein
VARHSGFQQALALMAHGDPALLHIVRLSLTVSGLALLISTLIGIPLGSWLALHDRAGDAQGQF